LTIARRRPYRERVRDPQHPITRRSLLLGAAGLAAAGLTGCGSSGSSSANSSAGSRSTPPPKPVHCPAGESGDALWQTAVRRGLVYGSSTATWQIADAAYSRLYAREAAILFTEDDMLWYRVRPRPTGGLDFTYSDRIVDYAEKHGMLVFGAHLAWDEGFGDGWRNSDLYRMDAATARKTLYGTIRGLVGRYRGRVLAWSTANEVIDGNGLRTDVPWYRTIGPSYVAESFRVAHDADPKALLFLNDFGFEVDDDFAKAADKRRAMLKLIDNLKRNGVPVHGLGLQAHLSAATFHTFDPRAYGRFLSEVADRGLKLMVTELDVLDDGLPPAAGPRDKAVAETYKRYLDAALTNTDVAAVITFGLSDRYTWLQEDYPRDDKAPRRPLPFDQNLKPKPALAALRGALAGAPRRTLAWTPPRC
jgi:endo-1,4-beta-xylanase